MKKFVALMLVLALALGCTAAFADTYGLGVSSNTGSSKAAAEDKNGTAQVDTTVCALVVDADGKIVSCIFDVAQIKVPFTAAGALTEDPIDCRSKVEKKEDYGMTKASPIGKELYEQVAFLQDFCTGKTLDEVVAGLAVENGYATNADVLTGCTIHVTDYVEALTKAYAQATAA